MNSFMIWCGTNGKDAPTISTKGLPVCFSPVIMRRADPLEPAKDRPWAHSAHDTAVAIADTQSPMVFLNGLVRPTPMHPDPISDAGRAYWEGWFDEFGYWLNEYADSLGVLAIDHARYPTRRKEGERAWLTKMIGTLRLNAPKITVGMYGLSSGVTYYNPYTDPSVEMDPNGIPWLIAPQSWRPQNGAVNWNEFTNAMTRVRRDHRGPIAIWLDSSKPWVTDVYWENLLAAIAIVTDRGAIPRDRVQSDLSWMDYDPSDFSSILGWAASYEVREDENEVQP